MIKSYFNPAHTIVSKNTYVYTIFKLLKHNFPLQKLKYEFLKIQLVSRQKYGPEVYVLKSMGLSQSQSTLFNWVQVNRERKTRESWVKLAYRILHIV